MIGFLGALGAVFFDSGCLLGVLFLSLALYIFGLTCIPPANEAAWCYLLAVCFAAPTAALLASLLLEKFCFAGKAPASLRQAAVLLSFVLIFGDNASLDYLEAAMRVSTEASLVSSGALLLSVVSAITFCAAMVALSLSVFALAFELPFRWLAGATNARLEVPYQSLRLLLVICGAALAFNLITGLFITELRPEILLGHK